MSEAGEREYVIRLAKREEAEQIAEVVRAGFASEAELYGEIPPLRESAADVEATFDGGDLTFVAEADGTIIGTVRGETAANGSLVLRRLAVLPRWRRKGVARALMVALEAAYPDAPHFELFTGSRSTAALSLYESLGYRRIRAEEVAPGLELVTLEKRAR